MRRLEGLEFWWVYAVEDDAMAQLLASPPLANLRTLILHHDRNGKMIGNDVLCHAVASPLRRNLVELGLTFDGVWRGPSCRLIRALCESPYLGNLRTLYISNAGDPGNTARMDLDTVRAMESSPNFANLRRLDFGQTSFTLDVWDEVLRLPWLSRLEWLLLTYARQVQGPDFWRTVAEIVSLPAYREAFATKGPRIDWVTRFVDPVNSPELFARGYPRYD